MTLHDLIAYAPSAPTCVDFVTKILGQVLAVLLMRWLAAPAAPAALPPAALPPAVLPPAPLPPARPRNQRRRRRHGRR